MLSASFLDESRAQAHIETFEQELLPDRYGYDTFSGYIEAAKLELSKSPRSEMRLLHRLEHAQMWYDFMMADAEDISIEADLKPIKYGQKVSSIEASHYFSVFRMFPPATHSNGAERLAYLDSLYPYIDLEKREAVQIIFALALHGERRDMIEKYLKIAKDEELYIGHWKYAPLLLGEKKSAIEAFALIARDPQIGDIIEPIVHYTR